MLSQQIIREIKTRLLGIYQSYGNGEDVSPATLFRTEGFIEAACFMGVVTEDEVTDLMAEIHQRILNCPLQIERDEGIRIYSSMKRAPVYPSTQL